MSRALVCRSLSDDFSGVQFEARSLPQPRAGEVRVHMKSASLNFPDVLMTQGKYQLKPDLPFVCGMEGAGIVTACGAGVDAWKPNDEVVVGSRFGMFAEDVTVPAASLRAKPPAMSWSEAASYPTAWLTAYVALIRCGQLARGEVLLVHGAAGGVGMAAVDLGLLMGAIVIATASTEDKRKVLTARGAHHVIDPRAGFRDEVKRLTDGRGADVIYDPVGGDIFDESVRSIAFGGRLLVIGFAGGRIATVSSNMPLIKGFSVVGVRAGEYGRQFPERGRENVQAVETMARAGQIKPYIGLTVPFDEALSAFRGMAARHVIGKAAIAF